MQKGEAAGHTGLGQEEERTLGVCAFGFLLLLRLGS